MLIECGLLKILFLSFFNNFVWADHAVVNRLSCWWQQANTTSLAFRTTFCLYMVCLLAQSRFCRLSANTHRYCKCRRRRPPIRTDDDRKQTDHGEWTWVAVVRWSSAFSYSICLGLLSFRPTCEKSWYVTASRDSYCAFGPSILLCWFPPTILPPQRNLIIFCSCGSVIPIVSPSSFSATTHPFSIFVWLLFSRYN